MHALRKHSDPGQEEPSLFRSYHHPRSNSDKATGRGSDPPEKLTVWEVGRAALATPSYFKSMKLQEDSGKPLKYIDGGIVTNNLSVEIYNSFAQAHGEDGHGIRVLINIGTGSSVTNITRHSKTSLTGLSQITAASEKLTSEHLKAQRGYSRLDVGSGIGMMKFDNWKGADGFETLDTLRTKTKEYVTSPVGRKEIAAAAKQVVHIRRLRSTQRDLSQWERFCYGVRYVCTIKSCNYKVRDWVEPVGLRRHLESVHQSSPDIVDFLLEEGKISPVY